MVKKAGVAGREMFHVRSLLPCDKGPIQVSSFLSERHCFNQPIFIVNSSPPGDMGRELSSYPYTACRQEKRRPLCGAGSGTRYDSCYQVEF